MCFVSHKIKDLITKCEGETKHARCFGRANYKELAGSMPALYPAYLKLQRCWLLSLTRITDLCQLIGVYSFAAYL
ncbi:hypothetical protein CS537_07895 [Yersinia mollaretii]|nr:hypothetical protein CS537_07895 [Yersinia mollaretii]